MESTASFAEAASGVALKQLRVAYPVLPEAYFSFLQASNGAEGELGVAPGWFVVWPAEDALVATSEYQLPEFLSGYFAFGGNGGGELFVFHLEGLDVDRPVFMVPAVGMAADVLVPIAPTFDAFRNEMGKVLHNGA